jgi:uncharacterized membrane protein YphA (DoxX/SURF4 family)
MKSFQKPKTNYSSYLIAGVSLSFILLFIYAATSKLIDFETFTVQLAQSPLLSAYTASIAWLVPAIEIAIAVLLSFPQFRTPALYAAFTLMVMFTAYIFIILNYSDFIPCSCGGVLEELSWTQHLIFNIVFIALAAFALFFSKNRNVKKKLLLLAPLALIGVGIVALLFAFSEKKMHRNNAFQRRYMPHPNTLVAEKLLAYDTYYLAGYNTNNIYLGNYNAPLYLTQLDWNLQKQSEYQVSISNTGLPYKRVRAKVVGDDFFVGDGTVPILFKGNINTLQANYFSDKVYFNHYTPADPQRVGFVTVSSETRNIALALLRSDRDSLYINTSTLTQQLDGIVDTDGYLLWNHKNQQFIYVYRYRNRYEVLDENMNSVHNGKTIDTISKGVIDLAYYKTAQEFRIGGKTIVVNHSSATFGDYLFIESDRLGKYDDVDLSDIASIIDVYNFVENTYEFSFYLYHEPKEELKDFLVKKNKLIAIIGMKIRIEKLEPRYFTIDSNTTHTAQYQE